jgi:predicted nucleic acid-binding protein
LPSHRPRLTDVAANVPARLPRRLFVDSGAWIALRSRRDQHHAEADRLFRNAVKRGIPLVTTNLVIADAHRLTLFRAGVEPASRALDRIEASGRVAIHFATADDHASALSWLMRLKPRPVTYTDAVSFAAMETTACSHVLGFDDDFVAAGFSPWRDS